MSKLPLSSLAILGQFPRLQSSMSNSWFFIAVLFFAINISLNTSLFVIDYTQGWVSMLVMELIIAFILLYVIKDIPNVQKHTIIIITGIVEIIYKIYLCENIDAAATRSIYDHGGGNIILSMIDKSYLTELLNEGMSIKSMSDGGVDYFGNLIYITNFTLSNLDLGSPGISYVYAGISVLFGEYNRYLLGLLLFLIVILSSLLLYIISRDDFNLGKYSILPPIMNIVSFDLFAANITLFKDVIMMFLFLLLLLITIRNVNFIFKVILTSFIAYSITFLRVGMAVPVMCIIMVPFVWNRDMRSLTIAFVSCIMYIFMLISIQGNHIYYHVNNVLEEVGISSYHDAISSAKFQINKIANRAARVKIGHVSNKEESLGNKINVLDIKHDNFYYAIPLKIVLQVVAPFPIDRYSNFYDLMNRINGFIYTLLLPFAALSVIGYTTRNDDTNFGRQYLNNYKIILSYFFLLSIAVAFSGPWLSPRYRIMLSGILLIIATIGLSNLNKQQKTSVFMVTLIVTSTVHMYYQNIKVFLLSLL